MSQKKQNGQFYTTNATYILSGMPSPPSDIATVIEPFAGKGDLVDWVRATNFKGSLTAYDIDPKRNDIICRDTLLNPPDYTGAWIITNPPYLARNKSADKTIYDLYESNDLYKCFLATISGCRGGIVIIPAGFFFSPREMDVRCRNEFMTNYRITMVKYFEETVFSDTTTTVVAIAFETSFTKMTEQSVVWRTSPSNQEKVYTMTVADDWIIGGDIYRLPIDDTVRVRRFVVGQPLNENEQQTYMTLNALDSGKHDGRISLTYKKDYLYPAKDCSRTYATLRISGRTLSESEQIRICELFNQLLEEKREATWSLFLPQFRESKEYARKRIPFELAYTIVRHLVQQL